jgi:hypothetical protein
LSKEASIALTHGLTAIITNVTRLPFGNILQSSRIDEGAVALGEGRMISITAMVASLLDGVEKV